MIQSIIKSPQVDTDNSGLQLAKIEVDSAYLNKWNESSKDFFCLVKNGQLLRPTLYRIGGMNNPNIGKDKYFMLLKYIESVYPKSITDITGTKNPNYLAGHWCIIDQEGNEKVVFEQFQNPWLIKDSCLYSVDNNYYNIETGEDYGYHSSSMRSKDYVFLDHSYHKDQAKRGILKVKKSDGTSELFPEK